MKKIVYIHTYGYTIDQIKHMHDVGAYIYYLALKDAKINDDVYQYADEIITIDKYDESFFINFAKEHQAECIYANDSENMMEPLRRMNEALGKRFYHTKEQWEHFVNNKNEFKKTIKKYGINTPKTYFIGNVLNFWLTPFTIWKYPVIIKPVDGIASYGMSIVKNPFQIPKAVLKAGKCSKSRHFIVEEYYLGQEISATYVVQNNNCKLVFLYDKFLYRTKYHQRLPYASVSPSFYYDEYMKDVNPKVLEMAKQEGLNNCIFFLQGIYKKGKFAFFESSLRREGGDSNFFLEHFNHENYLFYLIDYLLDIRSDYDVEKDDPCLGGSHFFCINPVLDEGIIKEINNFNLPLPKEMFYKEILKKPGDIIHSRGMFESLLGCYCFDTNDIGLVKKEITKIYQNLEVLDQDGNDMLYRDLNYLDELDKYYK